MTEHALPRVSGWYAMGTSTAHYHEALHPEARCGRQPPVGLPFTMADPVVRTCRHCRLGARPGAPLRPRDPEVVGETLVYMAVDPHEAVRRLLELAFRDAHTALDLTHGAGGFWRAPYPPGLSVVTNNPVRSALTDQHLDFTRTLLDAGGFDVVLYDPPHLADGGRDGIMARRYGTATRGVLEATIAAGAEEAWRLARVGVIVKVTDHSHGGRWVSLSDLVKRALREPPYCVLHTVRATYLRDSKWTVQRVPRNNGATYLVWRKDGPTHRDWRESADP